MVSKKKAKGIIASVAFANGFVLELGLSPWDVFIAQSTDLTPIITIQLADIVRYMIAIATAVEILLGVAWMYEYGKLLGVIAFGLAFLGGVWVIYTPVTGVVLYMLAIFIVGLAPDYGL